MTERNMFVCEAIVSDYNNVICALSSNSLGWFVFQ
ncbi:hypothetical protein MPC1_3410004 [Methylocella tundrae]|nr:hypothetical protein MPC1_3410004 [Methylocella tundrae]